MATTARKVTTQLKRARLAGAEHEEPLMRAYRAEIRRFGRMAAERFRELTVVTAAAEWTAPTVAEVTSMTVRTARVTKAQRTMLAAIAGTVSEIPGVDFTITHPVAQRILDGLGARVPQTVADGAREPIAHAIAQGWAEGASVPDTAAAIQKSVLGVSDRVATLLARTDLIGMSNGAGQNAVHQVNDAAREDGDTPPIQTKTWIATPDDRTRETHAEADGQTVAVEEPYTVGEAQLMYPGDPDGPDEEVWNCRCTEIYNEDSGDQAGGPGGEDLLASGVRNQLRIVASQRSVGIAEAARITAGVRAPAVPFQASEEEALMSGTLLTDPTQEQKDVFRAAFADLAGRQAWGSDIAFEGVSTGDGRYMVEGSLAWREPPLTLMAMIETPEFGGHAGAQVAGRMDTFEKRTVDMEGEKLPAGVTTVYSTGIFDSGEYAQDIERMVGDETLRGVSVDLAINEWGFRDPDTGEILNPDEMTPEEWDRAFMGELEFAVIQGDIMAATVCPTPAFADARIALLASAVTRYHPHVWVAGPEYAATIGVKPGKLMTTLTRENAIKPLTQRAVTAAGGIAPLDPPRAWFFRPEPNEPTPITVTADGEIYGHAALWESCHTGFINGEWSQCIRPPRSKTDYACFHLGEIETAEGDLLPIGHVTVGCGHAPMNATPKQTRDHYDNAGTIAAFVRVIDGVHGPWLSGATRSDMTAEQLRDLRACPPSGDWRSVNHNLEMHAILSVVVPGFQVPRSQVALAASADGSVEVVALILTASVQGEQAAETPMSAEVLAAFIDDGGAGLDGLIQSD